MFAQSLDTNYVLSNSPSHIRQPNMVAAQVHTSTSATGNWPTVAHTHSKHVTHLSQMLLNTSHTLISDAGPVALHSYILCDSKGVKMLTCNAASLRAQQARPWYQIIKSKYRQLVSTRENTSLKYILLTRTGKQNNHSKKQHKKTRNKDNLTR